MGLGNGSGAMGPASVRVTATVRLPRTAPPPTPPPPALALTLTLSMSYGMRHAWCARRLDGQPLLPLLPPLSQRSHSEVVGRNAWHCVGRGWGEGRGGGGGVCAYGNQAPPEARTQASRAKGAGGRGAARRRWGQPGWAHAPRPSVGAGAPRSGVKRAAGQGRGHSDKWAGSGRGGWFHCAAPGHLAAVRVAHDSSSPPPMPPPCRRPCHHPCHPCRRPCPRRRHHHAAHVRCRQIGAAPRLPKGRQRRLAEGRQRL